MFFSVFRSFPELCTKCVFFSDFPRFPAIFQSKVHCFSVFSCGFRCFVSDLRGFVAVFLCFASTIRWFSEVFKCSSAVFGDLKVFFVDCHGFSLFLGDFAVFSGI